MLPKRCALLFQTFLLVTVLLLKTVHAQTQDANVEENNDISVGMCKTDASLANMCRACAALPSVISLPVEDCCRVEEAQDVCQQCLDDPSSCLMVIINAQNELLDPQGVNEDDESLDSSSSDEAAGQPTWDTIFKEDAADAAGDYDQRLDPFVSDSQPIQLKTDDTPDVTYDELNDDVSSMDKRWGTLGFGSSGYGRYARLSAMARNAGKRWGSLGISKRWGSLGIGNWKRWGSLGIGYGKRWGSLGIGNGKRSGSPGIDSEGPPISTEMSKKWGSLSLGTGKRWGSLGISNGKRWGSLGLSNGKRWGSLGLSNGKRWGSLGLSNGKRWGSLGIGKKWGTLGIGKRWGSLGIGNWKLWGSNQLGSRYRRGDRKRWGTLAMGKRSDYFTDDNENDFQPLDEEKRWGTLGLGNSVRWGPYLRGKRWGSLGLSGWRKRWGQLGLGRGKRWGMLGIGKREEILTPLDNDNESFLDTMVENDPDYERWGTLNFGKRGENNSPVEEPEFEDLDSPEEKRWGTLSMGKRWGNLGGFGGFRQWGSRGMGFGYPSSSRRSPIKRSAELPEPTIQSSEISTSKEVTN